ncbi:MAG: MBOAT family protein, partial [Lachnospiraceae bacterium]|nr:MBOAT family protein [Lachnospiraceae bacterium]
MLFTSYSFIGFVSLLGLVYYLVPGKHQWKLLLLGSLVFYAFSGPWNLLYVLATSLTVWGGALAVEKNYADKKARLKELKKADLPADQKKAQTAAYKKKQAGDLKRIMVMTITLNLLILAVVKYTNFLISNLNGLLGAERQLSLLHIALPMGISFYTLQAIGYLVDV